MIPKMQKFVFVCPTYVYETYTKSLKFDTLKNVLLKRPRTYLNNKHKNTQISNTKRQYINFNI